jgi:hypothetical protein
MVLLRVSVSKLICLDFNYCILSIGQNLFLPLHPIALLYLMSKRCPMYVWVPVFCRFDAQFLAYWVIYMCDDFIKSYIYSFFAEMGHPDVRWSVISPYSKHNRLLLSVPCFTFFLTAVCTKCLILKYNYFTFCFSFNPSKHQPSVGLFLINQFLFWAVGKLSTHSFLFPFYSTF